MSDSLTRKVIRKNTVWRYKGRFGPGTIVKVLFSYTVDNVTWVAFMPVNRQTLGGVMRREDFCRTFTWFASRL